MVVGAGPISSASGDPPCAAQHGPHTTARNTVARGRPTRTQHVTHNSPSSPVPLEAPAAPAGVRVIPGATGAETFGALPEDAADAAVKSRGSGALVPARVSSPGNAGPRRSCPDMVAPACSGRQKPTRRTRLCEGDRRRERGCWRCLVGSWWNAPILDCRGVLFLCAKR